MGCVVRLAAIAQGPAGEAIVNTFHYDSGLSGSFPLLADLLTDFETNIVTALKACVTSSWVLVRTRADVVAGDGAGTFDESLAMAGDAGTLAGTSAPLQTCIVIKKLTTTAKRWARGRIFVSPRIVGDFSVNGVVTATPTGIATLMGNMVLSLSDGVFNYQPVIWASALHGSTAISNVSMSTVAGVRRSRRQRPLT